jgi:hypothetical protein
MPVAGKHALEQHALNAESHSGNALIPSSASLHLPAPPNRPEISKTLDVTAAKNLVTRLGADASSAASAAILVAPIVTVIDR